MGLSFVKPTFAGVPNFSGHVYYTNLDGSKTTRGVPDIYVKWTDKDNHYRYAKTDSSGEYVFESLYEQSNAEEKIRRMYRTWIIPDQPDITPFYDNTNPNKDYTTEGYTRMLSLDLYDEGLGCSYNPHKFEVIKPKNWEGRFIDPQTQWSNDDGNAITQSKILNDTTVIDVNFNNSQDRNGNSYVANFYFQPTTISGVVIDTQNNRPIPNTPVNVYNASGQSKTAVTDADGRYSVSEFIGKGQLYAVRINTPSNGYKNTPKTSTIGWTRSFIYSLNPQDPENKDTPVGSDSYEKQKLGTDDCAGPAFGGPDQGKIGRCSFKLEKAPPSTSPTITVPAPTATITNPPIDQTSPTSFPNPLCSLLPTTGSRPSAIKVDNRQIDFSTFSGVNIPLSQESQIIPIDINYSNGACRTINIRLNYSVPISPTLTPSPTPDPTACSADSNRPDRCLCNSNIQCRSNLCDQTLGGVCNTPARIKTGSGDVHSQEEIKGRE